jgi:hypothetical protein
VGFRLLNSVLGQACCGDLAEDEDRPLDDHRAEAPALVHRSGD